MSSILSTLAFLSRRKNLDFFTFRMSNLLANTIIKQKRIKKAENLNELGKFWQKGFPSSKQVPITEVDENTVYAEIHTPCPLRNSGDTLACWKMMAYDRRIVEQAGGNFVVLSSQAESGNTFCKVAMRFKDQMMDNLQQAHLKSIKKE